MLGEEKNLSKNGRNQSFPKLPEMARKCFYEILDQPFFWDLYFSTKCGLSALGEAIAPTQSGRRGARSCSGPTALQSHSHVLLDSLLGLGYWVGWGGLGLIIKSSLILS